MNGTAERLFGDFSNSLVDTTTLMRHLARELYRLPESINLVKALVALEESCGEDAARHRKQVIRLAELAPIVERETADGFPLLFGISVIAIWAEFEAFVEDLAVLQLLQRPSLLLHPEIQKIKAPVAQYFLLEGRDRAAFIVSQLQRDNGGSRDNVVTRTVWLLSIIGITCQPEQLVAREIVELHAVRNLLAHKRGIIDAKFMDQCHWLSVELGKRHTVSETALGRYVSALLDFAGSMLESIQRETGAVSPELVHLRDCARQALWAGAKAPPQTIDVERLVPVDKNR